MLFTTQLFPEFGQALLALAAVYIQQGRYAEAMEALNATERLLPNRAEVKTYKGFAHFFLGDAQDARTCWDDAVELDPTLAERFEVTGLTL